MYTHTHALLQNASSIAPSEVVQHMHLVYAEHTMVVSRQYARVVAAWHVVYQSRWCTSAEALPSAKRACSAVGGDVVGRVLTGRTTDLQSPTFPMVWASKEPQLYRRVSSPRISHAHRGIAEGRKEPQSMYPSIVRHDGQAQDYHWSSESMPALSGPAAIMRRQKRV